MHNKEKEYAFRIAAVTSSIISIVAYFIIFFLLNDQITDIHNIVTQKLQNQDIVLQKTLESELSAIQEAITQNIQQAQQSVISIVATKNIPLYLIGPDAELSVTNKETQIGGGSAIVIASGGYAITNKHVVQDAQVSYTAITADGNTYPISNIRIDPILDIAVIQVENANQFDKHTHIASFISRDDHIAIGQFTFAIGNALTQRKNTVTFGIISAKNRELRVATDNIYVGLLQTDAPINPGNSGGPLLNIYGKVIGINTAISSYGQGIGFALPLTQEFIDATIESIKKYNRIIRPRIGIVYTDITAAMKQKNHLQETKNGVYITDILPNSPAEKAGLQKGDIIIAINEKVIDMDAPFLYQLYTYKPGDTIHVNILRTGERKKIAITLAKNM